MNKPTPAQIDVATAICDWYFQTHRRHRCEPGMPDMYADPEQVGHFAVDLDALQEGHAPSLFTALVTTAMFQRLRDVLVKSILRGIPPDLADTLTNERLLRELARELPCGLEPSSDALRARCDLAKDANSKRGCCSMADAGACHLHRHTEALKRYGHFGKMPMSIALAIHDSGASDLANLYARATDGRAPNAASQWLVASLTRAWRVSDKIAAMFLSLVSNPDLLCRAPWANGLDWTQFVVIDSNVDLFLKSVGYEGPGTYKARVNFVRQLSVEIDLQTFDGSVQAYNPRLVQQALYLFMSRSNRADLSMDCSHTPASCRSCPDTLLVRCPAMRAGSLSADDDA